MNSLHIHLVFVFSNRSFSSSNVIRALISSLYLPACFLYFVFWFHSNCIAFFLFLKPNWPLSVNLVTYFSVSLTEFAIAFVVVLANAVH